MWNRVLVLYLLLPGNLLSAAEPSSRAEAEKALLKSVQFFRNNVAVQGTYLWQYSDDLAKREGEGKATTTQGWIQPPGTPAVGMAMLAAWKATGNLEILDAARETANALLKGQLHSGGWAHSMELDPKARKKHAYRDGRGEGRNVTTFDDDSTQAALRFLAAMDQALKFENQKIHEALAYAIDSIVKAQYPNGAWPQGYDKFPEPDKFPVLKANYPESWSRTWPGSKQYWLSYTLNDNNLATMVDTLFLLERIYEKSRFIDLASKSRAAAERAGQFLIRAQMPEPQPAWAQQYNFEMQPSWARKFEPPSITGGESQGAITTLLSLYLHTADRKFLEPIPSALAYLRRSRLPDGRLARFYELRSNKPLYFTKEYELTYDDSDLPTHYSFKVGDQTEKLDREYKRLAEMTTEELSREWEISPPKLTATLASEAAAIIKAQDKNGRWVEDGRLRYHGPNDSTTRIIRCGTFIHNVETLSNYLEALKATGN